jgi:N6-adenosine-specific RNA methylase IME4
MDEVKKKYRIIYADPPWEWKTYSAKGRVKTPDRHYPLMTIEEIRCMGHIIPEITDTNCILFMWVQDAHLKTAIEVAEYWGFTYKTIGFVWDKQNFGMGYWTRKGAEVCLLFTKGHPKRLSGGVRQFISEKATEHSKKPDIVRNRIVELMGDLPRIELFARQKTEGWDVWGNEVASDITLITELIGEVR